MRKKKYSTKNRLASKKKKLKRSGILSNTKELHAPTISNET